VELRGANLAALVNGAVLAFDGGGAGLPSADSPVPNPTPGPPE